MGVKLTLDQARSVCEQLALLKEGQYQNSQLAFSPTRVCLESNSLWRTTASYAHYAFPSYTYSRDLESLYPLVKQAADCLFAEMKASEGSDKYVMIEKWQIKSSKDVKKINEAWQRLEVLKNYQYSKKLAEAELIQKSIDCLATRETDIKNSFLKWMDPEWLV